MAVVTKLNEITASLLFSLTNADKNLTIAIACKLLLSGLENLRCIIIPQFRHPERSGRCILTRDTHR